jgi:hypothetical protein
MGAPGQRKEVSAMSRGLLVGGLIAMMTSSVAAQIPLVVWQGSATVLDVTDNCLPFYAVGDLFPSLFRPRLTPEEPETAMSFILPREAHLYRRLDGGTDQMHGAGRYRATILSSRSTDHGFRGRYDFNINPTTIAASRNNVTITGYINRFANIDGCRVQFRGLYTRRPE